MKPHVLSPLGINNPASYYAAAVTLSPIDRTGSRCAHDCKSVNFSSCYCVDKILLFELLLAGFFVAVNVV